MDDDDDAPPPLSSLSEQVEALRMGDAAQRTSLPTASTTVGPSPRHTDQPAKPALKKGFFDRPATKGGKQIPDFLRVEPDEEQQKYQKMKGELLDALKPTPDMVNKIAQNKELLAGFEDPEVMAAVNDVAQNPGNMKKYKDNPKVLAFYAAMGQMMGQKLEEKGMGGPGVMKK